MPGGALAIHAGRYAPDGGDFGSDLGTGQHAAQTGLRPLTELDLDGPDRRRGRHPVDQPRKAESAVAIAAAEVAGANLPDQVAAVEVVRRHPALAGVVQRAGRGCALVERGDGRGAERPEAHRRDVDQRQGPESFGPAASPAQHLGRGQRHSRVGVIGLAVRGRRRKRGVLDDRVVMDPFQIVVGAEPEVSVGRLRGRVHPAPLVTAERPLRVVVGDDVLAQLWANRLEQEPQVADDRVVAQDGVPALQQVPARQPRQTPTDQGGHGSALHAGSKSRSTSAL